MLAAATPELAQVTNVVHDLDRAVRFHRDVLGLPLLFQAPPSLAFFQMGAVRLMLSPPENAEQDHPGSVLYFRVADIEGVHRSLVQRGVEFVGAPHRVHQAADYDLWMAFFHDPDNNPMALMEEKRRAKSS
ncbi:MAG TPA: VOC family protein [Gemmatimonadales bacterium]|nr:VOC family protein [Gemmatimonadales bacterium]